MSLELRVKSSSLSYFLFPISYFLILLSSCAPYKKEPTLPSDPTSERILNPWEEAVPEIDITPPPYTVVVVEPMFHFKDFPSEREYFVRIHQNHEIVTVKDRDQPERFADATERAYAIARLELDWREANLDEKLEYHRKLRRQELERDLTLIDSQILFKRRVVADLKEKVEMTQAKIQANEDLKINTDETAAFRRALAATKLELMQEEAKLRILDYDKMMRDSAKLQMNLIIEVMKVDDLLGVFQDQQKFLDDIKNTVAPGKWAQEDVRIKVWDKFLVIRHKKAVIEDVRIYIERLRKMMVSGE